MKFRQTPGSPTPMLPFGGASRVKPGEEFLIKGKIIPAYTFKFLTVYFERTI